MTNPSVKDSGDGTRPTTSGGVDNIGAGKKFTTDTSVSGPAPTERMAAKKKDAEAAEHDDSDAFHLHEDMTPESNEELPPAAPKKV